MATPIGLTCVLRPISFRLLEETSKGVGAYQSWSKIRLFATRRTLFISRRRPVAINPTRGRSDPQSSIAGRAFSIDSNIGPTTLRAIRSLLLVFQHIFLKRRAVIGPPLYIQRSTNDLGCPPIVWRTFLVISPLRLIPSLESRSTSVEEVSDSAERTTPVTS